MATFHFSKIADFDRLEITERNKQALKTNQLCPTKINVCKCYLSLLFNPLTINEISQTECVRQHQNSKKKF